MHAERLLLVPTAPRTPRGNPNLEPAEPGACGERFRLRADYIQQLAAFNQATARYNLVKRAGVSGPAAAKAWAEFQNTCVASREAWARYRAHVSGHACKRPALFAAA